MSQIIADAKSSIVELDHQIDVLGVYMSIASDALETASGISRDWLNQRYENFALRHKELCQKRLTAIQFLHLKIAEEKANTTRFKS